MISFIPAAKVPTLPQASAINVPSNDYVVRQTTVSAGMDRGGPTIRRDVATIPAVPLAVSPVTAPAASPLHSNHATTDAAQSEVNFPSEGSPSTNNTDGHTPSIPAPSSLAVPVSSRLTTQLLEKLDLLISRQDLVSKFSGEASIGQNGRSTQQGTRPKEPITGDIPRISTAEGSIMVAQAISTLADRLQGLTEDLAIIRNVLGISTKASTSELAAHPATPHLGVPTGTTAKDAIVVDDDDVVASGASTEHLSRETAAGRGFMERLDDMEVDLAAKSNQGKLCDF